MATKPPSNGKRSKSPMSKVVTQAVQKIQGKVNFNAANFKSGKPTPELRIKEAKGKEQIYPLVGDRYTLGRSSRCDINIRNPVVSQTHLTLKRNRKKTRSFVVQDEKSTNGIYRGKKRFKTFSLFHGESFTLGPPELAAGVTVKYYNPPPFWLYILRYSLYSMGGMLGLLLLLLSIEWVKVPVYPIPKESTLPIVVYAQDGETPINPTAQNNTHRELKKLSDFSPYLPQAVIASEDSRFYWHFGVDPIGVTRAMVINLSSAELRQGASTLTQQLARSLFPEVGRQNTAGRKIREMMVALKLETFYSKDFILKTYLNRVYLGIGSYGFEDAAQFYFEKSASELNLSEAATLVAILPAPNLYNPVKDYDTAVGLRNRIIDRMVKMGMVSESEADRARRSRIEVSPKARETFSSTVAPYFYSYVLDELQTLLGSDVAQEGNFIIETALNTQLQKQAELALDYSINNDGDRLGFSQGAVVTLDSRNGNILALVGGLNYEQSQFNRVVQAKRQPGSTFKIFAYAAALEQEIDPDKEYSCTPLFWKGQQYRGCERSNGDIDMYRGVAQSENVTALRVAQDVGLKRVIDVAKRLGVTSSLIEAPGLVIGQSETNVLEMTGAYATIANDGIWNKPHAINRILDGSDCQDSSERDSCREIYVFEDDTETYRDVISQDVTDKLTDMLQEAVEKGTGKAAYIDEGEAGKTGTTDNNVDLWFIGYVPKKDLVTGVWLGNDDNSPTNGSSYHAASLWGKYMKQAVSN
ncbi:transglycosylase domain-containing protein [Pleurocapsa sp. PCC 7319]|uniref:transglycosylase domain-containing protein n=1 Tax=Pleurocapsa sp. PCC 7319 TaxID=118161 RepID=UPI00034D8C51|nr:transglycosylase domain-containing protein [Pleurocapsa sp. PCC 7319]